MTTTATRTRSQLATVWLLHQEGRQAGHADAEKAWAEQEARRDSRGHTTTDWFNPVEINIGLGDVDAAVAKWEKVAGLAGVCHVEIRDRRPGDRRNDFYA